MAKRRMSFLTWCKKDVEDERKINYTLKTYENQVLKFTSEDEQPYSMLVRLRNAWIDKIELINNEWFASLYED